MPFPPSNDRKKPAFLRKKADPMPPSDGGESEDEMDMGGSDSTCICPKCGHEFSPESDD